jgi:outer membrane protein assembly factor BamB
VSGSRRGVRVVSLMLMCAAAFAVAGSMPAKVRAQQHKGCDGDRYLVLIDARTGALHCASPSLSASASVADGDGGWFIGGLHGLAHLDGSGRVDPAFRNDLSIPGGLSITALVRHGSVLYAGWGHGVAAFDARTGKRIWTTPAGCLDCSGASGSCGGVCDVAFGNGVLYVVGTFGTIGGVIRHGAAALDARTGRPLSWALQMTWRPKTPPTVDPLAWGPALSVAVAGDILYLGGEFNFLDGRRHKNLAAVSARTGQPTSWTPATRVGPVDEIALADGELLVGGGRTDFAAFDVRTGRPFSWPAKVWGSVARFAVSGNTVYLGGNGVAGFKAVGDRDAHNLAAVRLRLGRFTSWTPYIQSYVDVETLSVSGHTVLAGGSFRTTP